MQIEYGPLSLDSSKRDHEQLPLGPVILRNSSNEKAEQTDFLSK